MTHSGSTPHPPRRSPSSRAACERRLWRSSSRPAGTRTYRHWPACPRWWSAGLPDADARALLDSVLPWPLDDSRAGSDRGRDAGNPLALLELPRSLTPAELAGGFGTGGAALPVRIEDCFRRQLEPLPDETRQLLLLAAAEPLGDPVLVWRATQRLGIGVAAAAPAIAAGLLEIGRRVRFRHPLERSAIYQAASAGELRRVHRVLAEVTDPERDPDRQAWHAAQAADGPDEDVAAGLEGSAGRAQSRGGSGRRRRVQATCCGVDARPGAKGGAGTGGSRSQTSGRHVDRGRGVY